MEKQFSAACERNRHPILAVLREVLADRRQVLEIGSGTGQHAVFFAAQLPHLIWQTSDLPDNHPSIIGWQQEAQLPNVRPPLALDAAAADWPQGPFDAVFSANTCHIMAWREVEAMFAGIGRVLQPGGVLCIYGPFNYNGNFTSASNAQFDASLRVHAPHRGIRDFDAVDRLAVAHGLALQADYAMPANNRLLVWQRAGFRDRPSTNREKTMDQQFEDGLRKRRQVMGEDFVEKAFAGADDFTQPLQEYITRNAWGTVWCRDGLDFKTRSLVTLAMLTALGRTQELKGHVRGALNNGATIDEIREVLLHSTVYCGVPLAVDAFRAAQEVLKELAAVEK